MALSDIIKKYGDTTGIMQQPYTPPTTGIIPYKTVASNYQVYNTDTNTLEDQQTFNYEPIGIMSAPNMESTPMPNMEFPTPEPQAEQPFITGPSSVISYGTTEEGTPRLLTDIQTGETTYADTGQPYTPPAVDTTPPEDTTPTVDPCPEGYELINGVCQPIKKKEKSDRQEPITVEPKSLTNQARDLKGTINFDKDISATDPNLREGQYEYNPSRKTLNPFETGGIIGTVMNGLHNVGQWMNEQQAMAKGILRDTNGDGKPDTIDTVQVTRNYQEEELGLPPGARVNGAILSMQKDTQYNTLKNIFEESQVLGEQPQPTEPKKEEKTEPKKEEKIDMTTFNILENNAKQFGVLTPTQYGELFKNLEVATDKEKAWQSMIDSGVRNKEDLADAYRNLFKAKEEINKLNENIKKEEQKRKENIKAMAETNIARMKEAGASEDAMRSVYSAMENKDAREKAQEAYKKAQKQDRGQSASERQQEAQRRTQSVKKDISTGQRIRGGI